MIKYIPAIVFGSVGLFLLGMAVIPRRGGTGTAGLLVFPAGFFGVLTALAAAVAWLI